MLTNFSEIGSIKTLMIIVDSSDVFFWANYGGGHKCRPVNTTGRGAQVSSRSNDRGDT